MILKTEQFGDVEIEEKRVFTFIEPILGYENLSRFILLEHAPDSPFKWLQSVEKGNLAFPVTIPAYFGIDYQFTITEEDAKKLNITSAMGLLTLNITSIPPGEPEKATVNLAGPLIINTENNKGMQLVLVDDKFSIAKPLFTKKTKESEKKKEEKTSTKSKAKEKTKN